MRWGRQRAARALAGLFAAVLVAAPAAAPAKGPAAPWGKKKQRAEVDSYRARLVRAGDQALAQTRLMAQRTIDVRPGGVLRGTPATDVLAREALGYYDEALRLEPDAEAYYRAFMAAQYLEESSEERWLLVVRYFDGLRAVAPRDPRETTMLPEVCTSLAKLGGAGGPRADEYFLRGVAEYDTWRQRIDDTDPRFAQPLSTFATNAAELLMALGPDRLDDAIEYYETGIQYGPYEPLGYYGAAVAYDRDGQWGKAKEMMREALERDRENVTGSGASAVNHMARLTAPGVYFVPEGDIEYYYALGYHVQGRRAEALRRYRRFLQALPQSRFAARAQEHVAELEKELGLAPGAPPPPGATPAPERGRP